MPISLPLAALHLATAVLLGAMIGSERQIRQRLAGLRTNALVALGAAAFVTFAFLTPHEDSPTRVGAQVVSGIGFLGAGIIFRDGFTVHGLNTAATLWCSAAVGVLSGGGYLPYAIVMAGLVFFVNVGMRPLVKWIKRTTRAGQPLQRQFQVVAECAPGQEGELRALIVRSLSAKGLHLNEVHAKEMGNSMHLHAIVTSDGLTDAIIEKAVGVLLSEPTARRLSWYALDEG
ncbi:MAG: MgtC/SapB family protein [Paracoccaceae bacterium]|nr:MgtC/SapB family protein [Paracoccaceae bacterium]